MHHLASSASSPVFIDILRLYPVLVVMEIQSWRDRWVVANWWRCWAGDRKTYLRYLSECLAGPPCPKSPWQTVGLSRRRLSPGVGSPHCRYLWNVGPPQPPALPGSGLCKPSPPGLLGATYQHMHTHARTVDTGCL